MEFLKFMFSNFWIWLGFTILIYIVLYFGVNGIIRIVGAICGKTFKHDVGNSNKVWHDCKDDMPETDGLYYVKIDNTNSMYLCRYSNGKFTLDMYPDTEEKAVKWADYGAFTENDD